MKVKLVTLDELKEMDLGKVYHTGNDYVIEDNQAVYIYRISCVKNDRRFALGIRLLKPSTQLNARKNTKTIDKVEEILYA